MVLQKINIYFLVNKMNNFNAIPTLQSSITPTHSLDETQSCITENSPAELVVSDINNILAQMIVPDTNIDEALLIMKCSNRRSKLYIGTDTKLLGVINNFTLVSRNVLMIANRKGISRAELTVADVMSPIAKMPAIAKEMVQHARIGDIKKTMQQLGEGHIQIVDKSHRICGLISAVDISRALQVPIDINVTAHSFKDYFEVIHEHAELI